MTSLRSFTSYPSGGMPPIHMPFFFEAAILSRTRSPTTSRSNWAKDSSTLSVSRPMLVVVLNCLCDRYERNAATVEDLYEFGEIGERSRQSVDLVDDDHIDLACLDVGQQALQRRSLHRTARISTVIILGWQDR